MGSATSQLHKGGHTVQDTPRERQSKENVRGNGSRPGRSSLVFAVMPRVLRVEETKKTEQKNPTAVVPDFEPRTSFRFRPSIRRLIPPITVSE